MLFWIIAVLSVVGVLATVWGLYLLARRWLLFSSEPLGEAKGRNAMHRPWAVASPNLLEKFFDSGCLEGPHRGLT